MSTTRQFFKIFLPTVCLYFTTFLCVGQTANSKFNVDSLKTISQVAFDNLVDTCIKQLQTKQLSEISDSGHIKIMMCLNTILIASKEPNFEKRFTGGRYEKLETLATEKKYTEEIIKIYKEWCPNRGLGFYFPKLNMELYGTPRRYAWFNVTE